MAVCSAPTEEFDALSFIWILELVVIQITFGRPTRAFLAYVCRSGIFVLLETVSKVTRCWEGQTRRIYRLHGPIAEPFYAFFDVPQQACVHVVNRNGDAKSTPWCFQDFLQGIHLIRVDGVDLWRFPVAADMTDDPRRPTLRTNINKLCILLGQINLTLCAGISNLSALNVCTSPAALHASPVPPTFSTAASTSSDQRDGRRVPLEWAIGHLRPFECDAIAGVLEYIRAKSRSSRWEPKGAGIWTAFTIYLTELHVEILLRGDIRSSAPFNPAEDSMAS
ncbi:hypothetical protein ARMGADRAFT_1071353 [Armillaria gallica]|uniref:Uncharacterized protein n=1 Tax=Armillaria gallica TaxID=47427 RepID=A0A2H3E6T7_ARMGA|nr:hypothetical protein ARMGADRAFT_1071353 [Armillaria gallica]